MSQFADDVSTVLLYHFNEASGSVVNDSAYLHNSTLVNGNIQFGGDPHGPVWVSRPILGIDENLLFANQAFKIYLVPFREHLFIFAESKAICTIVELTGKVVHSCILHPRNNIQYLNFLKPGNYIIFIQPVDSNKYYSVSRVITLIP